MNRYSNYRTIKISTFILAFVLIVGYGIFNSRIFIKGPQLNIEGPINGSSFTDSPLVYVSGTAQNISFIDINGLNINTDENGFFKEAVLLYPGYNIVSITARDKFEREIIRKLELVYIDTSTSSIPFWELKTIENSTSSDANSTSTTSYLTPSLEFF